MPDRPQDLLREWALLNRKRKDSGVSPLEYLRWLDVRSKLEKLFPGKPVPGAGGKARVCIEFQNQHLLRAAVMKNVRPIGLFVRTPFGPEVGERFELRVQLLDLDERYDGAVTVVSNNVGPGFSTVDMGIGVRVQGEGSLQAKLFEVIGVTLPKE